jgi:hypothetical protein
VSVPCTYFWLPALYVCKLQDLVVYSLQSWLGFLPMNIVMAGVGLLVWPSVLRACVLLSGTGQHPPDAELWRVF